MDHDAYQELNARCQEVIAREGMLHIAAVAPVTKEFTKQLGLRDGWKEAMSSLASRGVPIYLFSSGYGDVVTQVLIQGLADSSSSSNGAGSSSSNSPMSSGELYHLSSSHHGLSSSS
jgi:2-hydroxy-3-keto-5-methylthiopentenyl-1-phosphate phosphatase